MADAVIVQSENSVLTPRMPNGKKRPGEPSIAKRERVGGQRANGSAGDPATAAIAQAVIHHLKGDPAGALKALVSVSPEHRNSELLSALGYTQTELGQYQDAARTYAELTQSEPKMADAWFQWGYCLHRLSQPAEALERFDKAGGLKSDWIEVPLAKAICELRLKQYPKALEHADECLAMNATYGPALFAKAVTYHVMWEFDQALALYRSIVEQNPKAVEALMNLITLGLQQKQYALVRQYSEQLLKFQPDVTLAMEGVAISAFNDTDYETAATHFRKLVELAPDQPTHWLNLGVVCERQGDLPQAIAAFTKTRQLRPDSLYAHTYLGGALWKAGQLEAARQCYEEAIAKWPEKEELTLTLAYVLEDLGEFEGGEEVCRVFCDRDPGRPEVWFRRGYLQFNLQQWGDAARSFERAMELKSDWPDAEIDCALAHYMASNYERADEVLRGLLERNAEHLEATKGLATVTLASGRNEESLQLHEKILQIGGPDADAYYNCGVLAHKLAQPERAVYLYRQAIEMRPDFAEALLNLGHALKDLGKSGEAHDAWISALELRPDFARGYFRRA